MRITKKEHKTVLSSLFYEVIGKNESGLPTFQAKRFPITKLFDAASAAKKLAEGSEEKNGRIFYKDGGIELTPGEIAILKELFEANKNWDITVADSVRELQELFVGK